MDADGSRRTVNTSINHKDFPATQYVRGVIHLSGYVLRPIEGRVLCDGLPVLPLPALLTLDSAGKPDECTIQRVTKIDPKGSIPLWVVNMFKGKAAKVCFRL